MHFVLTTIISPPHAVHNQKEKPNSMVPAIAQPARSCLHWAGTDTEIGMSALLLHQKQYEYCAQD
jgi:hypothetical protein